MRARTFEELGRERYLALTTYRRSGVAVTTPVWVAADGDDLVVVTGAQTGKAKRIRHTPRVTLRGSTVRGRVNERMEATEGRAEIVFDEAGMASAEHALREKYGWQFAASTLVENALVRDEAAGRVILRIRPAA
ncbi:PPOX class F420-dependent oxidoreductase [Cnuibacter sp. UC19_7]|uniref:PPOX class F420-dependent oxidoreductase n=1 Tax=Cnuibacter sp. UC19_7 TaxID=3350166 RepID=UPI0036703152